MKKGNFARIHILPGLKRAGKGGTKQKNVILNVKLLHKWVKSAVGIKQTIISAH